MMKGTGMKSNVAEIERRITRYWYTDGIAEMTGGGMFMILGLFFSAQEYIGENSTVSILLQASLTLLMIGGALISRRLINTLKVRLTYPRTGFVEYQVNENQLKRRRVWVIALAFVISALTMVFVRAFQNFDSIVVVTGAAVGLVLIVLRAKSAGLTRFYFLGGISLVLGLALSIMQLPNGYSLGLFYGLMGICFLVSGGLTLIHYLHENPLPSDGQDE
jgi:hypothetical protein